MGFLAWIILGFIAGVLAKWIMPGRDPGGFIVTTLIGVGGAFVGGYLGSMAGIGGNVSGVNLGSIVTAVAGALVLLFVYRVIKKS
ncbi:MAG: GlsB/YeaQ/YmgE family stress response membrane protein [Parahaliea sp.]